MKTANRTSTSNRVAAGVIAAYVRDLSRHPATSPADRRRGATRGRRMPPADFDRARDGASPIFERPSMPRESTGRYPRGAPPTQAPVDAPRVIPIGAAPGDRG